MEFDTQVSGSNWKGLSKSKKIKAASWKRAKKTEINCEVETAFCLHTYHWYHSFYFDMWGWPNSTLSHTHISLLSQKWEEVRKNSAAKRMNLIASCTNVVFFSAFFSSDKWRRSYCRHDKNLTWLRIHSFFLRFSFTLACYTLRQKSTKIQNTEKC